MKLIRFLLAALALFASGLSAQTDTSAVSDETGALEALRKDVDSVLDKLNLQFYGHFKLDMSRDPAETNFGNTAFFVKDYSDGGKDEEINISARHTRLGMNWEGPVVDGIQGFGRLEVDFLGKAVQKNTETMELQPALRVRLAYMKFDFMNGWSMTAGQDRDLFAPVIMKKINTMIGWGQGNIGFRRPMLAVSRKHAVGESSDLTWSVALARPVARDSGTLDGDAQDDGEDSGVPDLQAHVGWRIPGFADRPMKIGLGGFVGRREVGGGSAGLVDDEEYDSSCLALDASIPLTGELELIGELWTGTALDGYRGGVWQSYVLSDGDVRTIDAHGGFLNLIWKPVKEWRFVVGAGIDDPERGDFHGQNGRYRNTTCFANAMYHFYRGASVGIEYDRMETTYAGGDFTNDRIQVAFMLKF
jgi:hypothetical protein